VSQKTTYEKEGKGYVHVTLINEKNEQRVDDYQKETLKEISETVKYLLDNGAKMNDIAILVRKKKPIPDIAEYFARNMEKVPIVSNEAFLLSASVAVCTIIEALSYLNTDENTLSEIQLATVYQNQILHNDISLNQICQLKAEARRALLPEEFLQQYGMLRLLPLYELIENIIRIFHLQEIEHQEAYLFFFLDQVMEFLKKESGDILSFLNFWEENLSDKQIPAGKINGIQIHSIHASKGLEFKHVIIPFCDWELTRYGDPVWTETNSEDETELPVIPVTFGKDMKESDFKDSYNDELQQQWIDNINLLYVAFTRPKANLFIIGKCPTKKNGTLDNVSALLYHVLNNQEAKSDENEDFTYSFGVPYFSKDNEDKKTSENPLLAVPLETPVKIENHITHIEFRQSNKSKQFIGDQDTPENHDFIQQGLILHSIFSQIQTVKDVEPMLRQFEFDGIIGSNLTQNRISQLVHKALQNPIAKDWFSGDWEVINECSILQNTGVEVETHRPDRVMVKDNNVIVVDFKFGKPENTHIEQVQGYMNLLSQMGYQKVEGYLWYVYKNHIEPVTLN
jgi:ATP-dependent exoDNAse (exonuclease V) beta subunit